MKLPIPLERLFQIFCGITFVWSGIFMTQTFLKPLPDTTFVKIESVWEAEKESESLLTVMRENLERLRQPIPLASTEEIKELRNVFSPPPKQEILPPIQCETCGGENLGSAFICKHCGAPIGTESKVDSDTDGMPDYWENQYTLDPKDPSDAHEDPDNDKIDNLTEFLKGSNPRDDKPPITDGGRDKPPSDLPFNLIKTYQKPIQILFMGYIQLKDGRFEMQVNWAGKTEFYKVGDEIRGYAINDFKKTIETVPNPRTGVPTFEDVSTIVCQKKKFQPKTFVKGKLITDNDVFAKIRFSDSTEEREVHIDALIEDHTLGKTYKVADISLNRQEIIVVDEAKKTYTLKTQKGSTEPPPSGPEEE